jgi:DtxR family Mn-dependent transcriptional regulator
MGKICVSIEGKLGLPDNSISVPNLPAHPMAKELTPQAEEYLEAIFKLEQTEAGASTSGIAEELGIAPATVSGMLHRLRDKGLLDYEPYGNISLTERLLTDVLGLPWDAAHQQACLLEHAITDEIADAIEAKLGEVKTCPHGNPVDATATDESVPLDSLAPGECCVVAKVTDETPEMLNYLATLGVYPGVHICVEEKALRARRPRLRQDMGPHGRQKAPETPSPRPRKRSRPPAERAKARKA